MLSSAVVGIPGSTLAATFKSNCAIFRSDSWRQMSSHSSLCLKRAKSSALWASLDSGSAWIQRLTAVHISASLAFKESGKRKKILTRSSKEFFCFATYLSKLSTHQIQQAFSIRWIACQWSHHWGWLPQSRNWWTSSTNFRDQPDWSVEQTPSTTEHCWKSPDFSATWRRHRKFLLLGGNQNLGRRGELSRSRCLGQICAEMWRKKQDYYVSEWVISQIDSHPKHFGSCFAQVGVLTEYIQLKMFLRVGEEMPPRWKSSFWLSCVNSLEKKTLCWARMARWTSKDIPSSVTSLAFGGASLLTKGAEKFGRADLLDVHIFWSLECRCHLPDLAQTNSKKSTYII